MSASPKHRVVFMGTPDFAVPALQAILDAGHEVVAVYSQPPRPKGRGQQVQKSPVHELAEQHNIPVFTPRSLRKDAEAVAVFAGHNADVAVVAAYGLLLPKTVLDAPRFGCLNIHASLLPRWRGAAPIQYAVWRGDAQSGITIMQMDVGLDTGPMLLKDACAITPATTASSLHDALSVMGGRLIVQALAQLGQMIGVVQEDDGSTYAPMLKKEDGLIDWSQDATAIDRQVRALNPWPGTYCLLPDGKRLKVLSVKPADALSGAPGTLLDKTGLVACGDNTALQLVQVQPENARPMDVASALNGKYLVVGQSLCNAGN